MKDANSLRPIRIIVKVFEHVLSIPAIVIGAFLYLVFALLWLLLKPIGQWLYNQPWIGLGTYTSPDGKTERAKTLWDWMNLLLVPILIGGGLAVYNQVNHENELAIARQQAQVDREIAQDNARETALQDYLDRMETLLLTENLGQQITNEGAVVVAQTLTLTVARRIDVERRAIMLSFLHDAGLIQAGQSIVHLRDVDLSNARLEKSDLSGADLSGVELRGAVLSESDLSGANLSETDLTCATLQQADLMGAAMSNAVLVQADLEVADLSGLDLSNLRMGGADLTGAVLRGADLRQTDLRRALLINVDLGGADLRGVGLSGADMNSADLHGADLSPTDQFASDLSNANLKFANLNGANLRGAELRGARVNTDTTMDEHTTLPDGSKWTPDVNLVGFGVILDESIDVLAWERACPAD